MTTTPVRAIAAIAALALVCALAACAPTGDAGPVAESPTSPASESPEPTPTVEPADDPTPPAPPAPGIDAAERAAIVAGIEAGDPAAVGPFFADEVDYVLASSECCAAMTAAAATSELLSYASSSSGWVSPLDPAYLETVRGNYYYGAYVPADVISMRAASDGLVVILGVAGDRIVSVLIGGDEVLTYE